MGVVWLFLLASRLQVAMDAIVAALVLIVEKLSALCLNITLIRKFGLVEQLTFIIEGTGVILIGRWPA